MKQTFADTYYFLALLNPRDDAHQQATKSTAGRAGGLLTTHWVLTEVGDAFSSIAWRRRYLGLLDSLISAANVQIIPAEAVWFERGIDLYRRRPDKDWPLTDCISFVVMEQFGVSEALTADHHFEQAGFGALLRQG